MAITANNAVAKVRARNAHQLKALEMKTETLFGDVIDVLETALNDGGKPWSDKLEFIQKVKAAVAAVESDSSTTPTPRLPTGGSRLTPEQLANEILSHPDIPQGVRMAIVRVVAPAGSPSHLAVGDDGLPAELITARTQVTSLEVSLADTRRELEAAQKALDPTLDGSVAKQLAEAQARIAELEAGAPIPHGGNTPWWRKLRGEDD